ncbi:MAG TPA: hypothetical protein VFO35_04225 [Steroidobacteraceae bacterium]|nr:hypothetical protein [Steroidobacteraceae bacterium]
MSAERRERSWLDRFGKWSGAWLGVSAWFADQQLVSMTAFAKCPVHSHAFVVGVGAVCAVVALIGGLHSWRVWRALPESTADDLARTDRFIAALSILLAILSLLAIIFGTAAGVILRCER